MSSVKDSELDKNETLKDVNESQQDISNLEESEINTENLKPEHVVSEVSVKQPEGLNSDVISYVGTISRDGYTKLTQIIEKKVADGTKSDSLILVLTTSGGDPDYGYRIGRAINHYYDDTSVMIPDICKSAGTLVAIAGKSLIIGDLGELGPLDIQFRKTDEMGEQLSTLNIFKTVNELQNATLDSFRHFVTDIRYGSGIGTKLSAEIASNLTKALISPIAAQIDPIKLGEHNRALQIAKEYANRLNQISNNLESSDALDKLVSGYPCHSFVIDRKEAKQLFKDVRKPINENEAFIYLFARHYLEKGALHKAICLQELQVVDFNDVVHSFISESDVERVAANRIAPVDESSDDSETSDPEVASESTNIAEDKETA